MTMTMAARKLDAEGARLGAGLCIGQYLTGLAHAGERLRSRVVWGITGLFLLGLPAGAFLPVMVLGLSQPVPEGAPRTPPNVALRDQVLLLCAGVLVLLMVALLMTVLPPRHHWVKLFLYQGGIIQLSSRKPRPQVMRDADLATVTLQVVQGHRGDEFVGCCALGDHAGNLLTVTTGCELVARHAERVLADRLVDPLIDRIDAGLPVTFGPLTVDRAGITCGWTVAWREVRRVSMQLYGHRLNVETRMQESSRELALSGEPNAFLARYVIEYAAREAGVAVSVQ
jgi:hypothetical protein